MKDCPPFLRRAQVFVQADQRVTVTLVGAERSQNGRDNPVLRSTLLRGVHHGSARSRRPACR